MLKPQREGGGNNYFDSQMLQKLKEANSEELKSFILMERVYPAVFDNIITSCNYQLDDINTTWTKVVSELGVYGVVLSDVDGNLLLNKETGHLLRSKDVIKLDGGVVAGNACLDSPYLI